MAENFNLIFGSQAPTTASWSDADYQTGWNVVGSTPPTAEQFDALQNRADKKAQELNNRMLPLEQKAEEQGRQASTAYAVGAAVTVDGLPADWLLICTTAGTSGTVAITLPTALIDGAKINDGTITWTLRKVATNGSLGYRQPSTTYTAGQIAYHSALPTGWYLECTTAGTTDSGDLTISGTITPNVTVVTDGTVVWTVCTVKVAAQFNHMVQINTSGTWTAPVTGVYKITLKGGGSGGNGSAVTAPYIIAGSGGGEGGTTIAYVRMTAGDTANFTVGAGGAAGPAGGFGGSGGNSSVTINGTTYTAGGGQTTISSLNIPGSGGTGTIPGAAGGKASVTYISGTIGVSGASGGGAGGGVFGQPGKAGGGGAGGYGNNSGDTQPGQAGGDGYVIIEYYQQ